MRSSHIAFVFLSIFLITLFFLQWWQNPAYPFLLLFLLSLAGMSMLHNVLFAHLHTFSIVLTACLLGACCALSAVAHAMHVPSSFTVDSYAGQAVIVRGRIATEPDRRPLHTKYTLETEEIILRGSGTLITPIQGRVLVSDHRNWPHYAYGDHVTVSGFLERPGAIEDFRYDHYLSLSRVYAVITRGSIRLLVPGERNIFAALYALKERFEAQINRLYPEPHASFLAGLLTGSRKGIPAHVQEQFRITGLTHIVAISGYNITIIIAVISGLLFWLPLKWRFIPAVLAIGAFTIFVGASAAVVRAAIMGMLGLLALQLGRETHVRLAILWTAFFMLLWNPRSLWYDAGFQLSFLAVLGLTELSPLLERLVARVPRTLGIREALQMTCAAQLAAVPLIALLFGQFSLIAPLANIVVAPFIPLAMLFGFLGTMISFMVFPLGLLVAYIGWGCLEWIIRSAAFFSSVPYAAVDIPVLPVWLFVMYYVVIVGTVVVTQRQISFLCLVPQWFFRITSLYRRLSGVRRGLW